MKKRAIILAVITAMLTVNSGYAANTVSAEEMQKEESQASEIQAESGSEEASQVPIKPLSSKVVSENPYMAKLMPISITTAITRTVRTKCCRLEFILRSMFPTKR